MIFPPCLSVELFTFDGEPIEDIHPIIKRVMEKLKLKQLSDFTKITADEVLESKIPFRTLNLIREALDKKGLYLDGD